MRILFIYPDMISTDPDWQGYYYEGIAMLSAAARQAGHEPRLLHVYQSLADEQIVDWVQRNRDGDNTLIAFSATANQFPHVEHWAPLLKQATGLPTLVGGVHPTLSAESAIAADGVDMICCGDGEAPLVELCLRLQNGAAAKGVEGIWYKDGEGNVIRQGLGPLPDLDTLPLPDWEIYPTYRDLAYVRENVGIVMGSRGCPYNCAYCCNLALIKQSKGRGKYLRYKSVDNLIAELKVYLERYPNTWAFFFEDDIFGVWKKWLREFGPIYQREIGKPFGCNMRPNLVDEEMVGLLRDAGCGRVHMAIEAGDGEIRNKILNRRIERETLVESFRMFKAAGIKVQSYNIVGSPHESARAILETVKINAEIDPEWIQHSIFYPYEGTPLYDLVHKEGLVAKDREIDDYFTDTVLDQDCIRREQVVMFQRFFKPLVRHYQRLDRLPGPLRRAAVKASDAFLVSRPAPALMRAAERVKKLFTRRPRPLHRVPADQGVRKLEEQLVH